MFNLSREPWSPFREIERLQEELNRAFDSTLRPWGDGSTGLLDSGAGPAVDIYESHDELIVRADMPGMKKEDIEITVQGEMLTIRGERKEPRLEAAEEIREERSFGVFSRAFTLPAGVDASNVKAVYQNGVLELTLRKREEAKPKKIQIEAK